ncbi:MAG: SxtJ family membrane protein [Vicinamibacteria bacterium]
MTSDHVIPPATAKDLRNFGITFGAVTALTAAMFAYKGRMNPAQGFAVASVIFFLLGFLLPGVLRPFFGPWMKFAEILGYINTRILLGVFYFIGVTPMGLAMRVSGKDPMGRVFKKKGVTSYWSAANKHADGTRHFERQF